MGLTFTYFRGWVRTSKTKTAKFSATAKIDHTCRYISRYISWINVISHAIHRSYERSNLFPSSCGTIRDSNCIVVGIDVAVSISTGSMFLIRTRAILRMLFVTNFSVYHWTPKFKLANNRYLRCNRKTRYWQQQLGSLL